MGGLFYPETGKEPQSDVARWNQFVGHLDTALARVKRWRHAVDVGAHCGLYARKMAERFRFVYAFEPSRPAYDCLLLNSPSNVVAECFAIGDFNHPVTITDNKRGMVRIGERCERGGWSEYGQPGGWTQMVMLDDLHLPRVDFLKIDVDGYDLGVLKGGLRTIMRDRPVIMVEQYDKKPKVRDHYFTQTVTDYLTKELEMVLVDQVKFDLVFSWP